MRASVEAPGAGVTAAIQRGWLAGLPLEELEDCMQAYLRASARLCDLALLDRDMEECRPMLPEQKLQEASAARKKMMELTNELSDSIKKRDIQALCGAIARCEAHGWPPVRLEQAHATKSELQQLIGKLNHAQRLADVDLLSQAIQECEKMGMPERDVKEAKSKREQLLSVLHSLQAATDQKDPSVLIEAINAAKAGLGQVADRSSK